MCNCQAVNTGCCDGRPVVVPAPAPFAVKRVKQLNFQISETDLVSYLALLKTHRIHVFAMTVANVTSVGTADTAIVRLVTDDFAGSLRLLRRFNTLTLNAYKVLNIKSSDYGYVLEKWGIVGNNSTLHIASTYTATDGTLIVQPSNAEALL